MLIELKPFTNRMRTVAVQITWQIVGSYVGLLGLKFCGFIKLPNEPTDGEVLVSPGHP